MKASGRRFREDRDTYMLRYEFDRLLWRNNIVSVLGDNGCETGSSTRARGDHGCSTT